MLTLIAALRCCAPARARQADGEFGELADFAVDRDRAAMLLRDDVVADRQAEPGALAGRLGREERLEQLVADLRRDADAVVAHPDLDRVADVARRHLAAPAGIAASSAVACAACWRRRSRCRTG